MALRRIIARRPEAWRPRRLGIAYDRDEAGDAAAERLKGELAKLGIGSHRVLFPKGIDANEYACKVTPASQSLAVLLNRAEWWEKSTPGSKTEEPGIEEEKTAAKEEMEISSLPEI